MQEPKRYNTEDVRSIMREEELTPQDMTYLTAMYVHPMFLEHDGGHEFTWVKPMTISVFDMEDHDTGVLANAAGVILMLNTRDLLDYINISQLHPAHEADVYLWTIDKWESNEDLHVMAEWWRADAYPPRFESFNGTLKAPDLPQDTIGENND